jgi:hypothetical protein
MLSGSHVDRSDDVARVVDRYRQATRVLEIPARASISWPERRSTQFFAETRAASYDITSVVDAVGVAEYTAGK